MSLADAAKRLFADRHSASPEVRADRELIASEHRKAELDNLRADCREELERTDLSPVRREAIHALLRESYRAEGFRDDLIFDGSKWVTKGEDK